MDITKYINSEWYEAEHSNEPKQYYWLDKENNKGRYIRLYTPSLAAVVSKRSGFKVTPVKN